MQECVIDAVKRVVTVRIFLNPDFSNSGVGSLGSHWVVLKFAIRKTNSHHAKKNDHVAQPNIPVPRYACSLTAKRVKKLLLRSTGKGSVLSDCPNSLLVLKNEVRRAVEFFAQ